MLVKAISPEGESSVLDPKFLTRSKKLRVELRAITWNFLCYVGIYPIKEGIFT